MAFAKSPVGQLSLDDFLDKGKCESCTYFQPSFDSIMSCRNRECVGNLLYQAKKNLDKKPKVPIYHLSLTAVWCECPSCKYQPDSLEYRVRGVLPGEFYTVYRENCPWCGQPILWDWDEIDKKARKTKDYIEAEKRAELQKETDKTDNPSRIV